MKANPIDLINFGMSMAKTPRATPKREDKPIDLGAVIAQRRKELAEYEAIAKDMEKLHKKEEKKSDHWFNVRNISLFLIATTPITGPFYVWWFRMMLG